MTRVRPSRTGSLRLELPRDPARARAMRLWAAEKGFRLIEARRKWRYPYTCKHGHLVEGPHHERIYETSKRMYRWCLRCRVNTTRKQVEGRRAARGN